MKALQKAVGAHAFNDLMKDRPAKLLSGVVD